MEHTSLAQQGYTSLHTCIHKGGSVEEMMKLLQQFPTWINNCDNEEGHTPLHTAALHRNYELAVALIKHGANVQAPDKDGFTPLHIAVGVRHVRMVKLLLDNGAAAHIPDHLKFTPLHVIAVPDCTKEDKISEQIVFYLCEKLPDIEKNLTIEAREKNGYTPLYMSAKHDNSIVLRALINKGADINAADFREQTPLYAAASEGHEECVKILLDANADINKPNSDGETPFYAAIDRGHPKVMERLIEKDPDILHKANNTGLTPLHIAARKGNVKIVNALLERGIKANVEAHCGYTPLYIAIQQGKLKVIKTLLDRVDINMLTSKGTALHVAVECGAVAVVRILLERSADANIKNKEEKTSFDLASNHAEIKGILERHQEKLREDECVNKIIQEIKQHLVSPDYKIEATLKQGEYEITIEHKDFLNILSVYFLLKRKKLELVINFAKGKLILRVKEERSNDIENIFSLFTLKEECSLYENMRRLHNTLWASLEIGSIGIEMTGALSNPSQNKGKRANRTMQKPEIIISYSFSDVIAQQNFKDFLIKEQLGHLGNENFLKVVYPWPIKLDIMDSEQEWIKKFEALVLKAEEFTKNRKIKTVSDNKLYIREGLDNTKEMLKSENELYKEELRKKEERAREQELQRRKTALQLKKIVPREESIPRFKAGKKSIQKYNRPKAEIEPVGTEDEKLEVIEIKSPQSIDTLAPGMTVSCRYPIVELNTLKEPSELPIELKRSELNFLPATKVNRVKKSQAQLKKGPENSGLEIEDFIKLVNRYDPVNRDQFIIRAIYYRVIHALNSRIEGAVSIKLEPSSLEKLKQLRNAIVHNFCMDLDDRETQNKLLEIAWILCDKSKHENVKIQNLKTQVLIMGSSRIIFEKKDCVASMNKELEYLKSALKQLGGKTNFYSPKYPDLVYSCWVSVCIIVEYYHSIAQQKEFQPINGNRKIFSGKMRCEYRKRMITIDELLEECSRNIRNPLMHKLEKPSKGSTAAVTTITTVFDRDIAYNLVSLLNNCKEFSLEKSQNSTSFFVAANGQSPSGPSGETPKKEQRWKGPQA